MTNAGTPSEQLYREIAFIAYHFHWPYEEILALEHADRRRWCEEISRINEAMNAPEPQAGKIALG